MKKQKKTELSPLDKVLEDLAHLISELNNNLGEKSISPPSMMFSNEEDGSIALNSEEASKYNEYLKNIINSSGRQDHISTSAIDKTIKQCILSILDINKKRQNMSFQDRITKYISELKTKIMAPLEKFNIYFPVAGLSTDGLPIKVGRVHFIVFDEDKANTIRDHFTGQNISDEYKSTQREIINKLLGNEMIDRPVAIIEVLAIEAIAAKNLALKEIRLTIDIINFFSDFVPYSHGHIYLRGEEETARIAIPTLHQTEKTKSKLQSEWKGPLDDFSLARLEEVNKSKHFGLEEIIILLNKQRNQLNSLEKRVLAAIQWAGRATIDNRNEEAFLLYAIALESIILADSDKIELNYRLRVRVAHLLGKTIEDRKRIFDDIRNLYTIRSSIVHNGTYEVLEDNLKLIRLYTKGCIVQILTKEPFKSMINTNELADWFSSQVLS